MAKKKSDIDDFFKGIDKKERPIALKLRKIILKTIPHVKEKLSYGVPFYSLNKRICFIWPACVPWMSTKSKKSGVEFGLCFGVNLIETKKYLDQGERKQVFIKTIHSVDEIDEKIIQKILIEAVLVDQR